MQIARKPRTSTWPPRRWRAAPVAGKRLCRGVAEHAPPEDDEEREREAGRDTKVFAMGSVIPLKLCQVQLNPHLPNCITEPILLRGIQTEPLFSRPATRAAKALPRETRRAAAAARPG